MPDRKYYEAYDDRYRQVHERKLQWASDAPSAIVAQVLERFFVSAESKILELGCGEGRDAAYLLNRGYAVTATDILNSRRIFRFWTVWQGSGKENTISSMR